MSARRAVARVERMALHSHRVAEGSAPMITADTITDEQIRALRDERTVRRRGGNATLGKVTQHFPPLVWERAEAGVYRGYRDGWVREYRITREGYYGWRVFRRYKGGEHLASCATYRSAKQWTQLLADGEIKGTPEWIEVRARCAEILNARAAKERKPSWVLVRVPSRPNGKPIDHWEAAQTFAHEPWASEAQYLGYSGGLHCFQRPPEKKR